MKTMPFLIGICLAATFHGLAAAEDEESLKLETEALRLELGQKPAPFIQRLTHKQTGLAVIDGPAAGSLFFLTFTHADGRRETVEAISARESNATLSREGASTILKLRYSQFAAPDLAVEVKAECGEKSALTFWTIRITRDPAWRVSAVRFPQFVAAPAIGDAADDVLVLPALAGTLIQNPAETWRDGQSVTLAYPGNLSAQFLAYQDRSAGVSLAGRDSAGYPMSLVVLKQADGFRIWHETTAVADEPGAQPGVWEGPYPVALGVTQGTWCHTADQYKEWALQQPWCAKRLSERTDIPAWWKDGPAVHVCEVRTYDGKRTCSGSYYPKLREHLQTFREKIDGPVVPMLAGWENHRRWTAGDYFPVFDAGAAVPVMRQLRDDGFRPFFFLSGLYSTFRNEGRDGGEIAAAQQHLASYVLGETTGKPKEYLLNESSPGGEWKRHSYQFCVGAPGTREFFLKVVDQAQAAGVDVLQMDQTVSGAGDVCFSKEHGHQPGAGLYQSRAFRDLLDALRAHGKRRSSGFVLFHEEPHEQLIPHLDGFHMREYYEKRWYRGYPGAVGIPLFSYLYHEFAAGYGGDSAGLSKDNSRWNVRCHAMNLVAGRTPGAAIWSSHQNMRDAHPDQIAVIRNHCRLLKTRAKDFLMLGRMLHPVELDVPKVEIVIPVQRGGQWVREDVPTPSILTSSWQAPDGRIGHLFVNIAETRQALRAGIDSRNAPAGEAWDVSVYRSAGAGAFEPLWQGQRLPKDFAAELEPLEAVFIELRRAGAE